MHQRYLNKKLLSICVSHSSFNIVHSYKWFCSITLYLSPSILLSQSKLLVFTSLYLSRPVQWLVQYKCLDSPQPVYSTSFYPPFFRPIHWSLLSSTSLTNWSMASSSPLVLTFLDQSNNQEIHQPLLNFAVLPTGFYPLWPVYSPWPGHSTDLYFLWQGKTTGLNTPWPVQFHWSISMVLTLLGYVNWLVSTLHGQSNSTGLYSPWSVQFHWSWLLLASPIYWSLLSFVRLMASPLHFSWLSLASPIYWPLMLLLSYPEILPFDQNHKIHM